MILRLSEPTEVPPEAKSRFAAEPTGRGNRTASQHFELLMGSYGRHDGFLPCIGCVELTSSGGVRRVEEFVKLGPIHPTTLAACCEATDDLDQSIEIAGSDDLRRIVDQLRRLDYVPLATHTARTPTVRSGPTRRRKR